MYVGLSVVGLLLSVLCFFFQRETLNSQTEGTVRPGLTESCKRLFASRLFMALVLLTCGSVGIYYAFIGGSPYVLMQLYGLSASAYGIWFAVVAIGYLTGNFLAGRYSSQIGVNRMIVVGSIPGVLGFVLFWLLSSWQHPLALFLPMQLIALWNGITLPNLMSAVMSVMPDIAGAASGLAGTLMTGIGIVFTLILSFITAQTVLPLLLVISFSAGMALLGFLMWLSIVREPAYSTQVPGPDDDNELD